MCDFQLWWILWRACFLQSCPTPVLIQEWERLHDTPVCPFPSFNLCPPPSTSSPGSTESPRRARALWVSASACSVRTRGWWSASTKRACKWVDSCQIIAHVKHYAAHCRCFIENNRFLHHISSLGLFLCNDRQTEHILFSYAMLDHNLSSRLNRKKLNNQVICFHPE